MLCYKNLGWSYFNHLYLCKPSLLQGYLSCYLAGLLSQQGQEKAANQKCRKGVCFLQRPILLPLLSGKIDANKPQILEVDKNDAA